MTVAPQWIVTAVFTNNIQPVSSILSIQAGKNSIYVNSNG
jgi:hypothetical protein